MARFETVNRKRQLWLRSPLLFVLISSFIFFLGRSSFVGAQEERQHRHGAEEAPARRTLPAVPIEEKIVVDGELNEPAWRRVAPSHEFRQRDTACAQNPTWSAVSPITPAPRTAHWP